MRTWGFTFILFAALSAVLPYFGMQLLFLVWINHWGLTTGWIIRGVLLGIGVALVIAGWMREAQRQSRPESNPYAPTRPPGPPPGV